MSRGFADDGGEEQASLHILSRCNLCLVAEHGHKGCHSGGVYVR